MSFMKPILILVVLLTTLLAKGAHAAWLPDSFKIDYVSVSIGHFSEKEIKHEGQLLYKHPKRLKLIEKKEKGKTIFVLNPFESYYFKEASLKGVPNELTIAKSADSNLSTFFDVLTNSGLKSNDLYKVDKNGTKAVISFTKKGVKQLELRKATMTFTNIKYKFQNMKELSVEFESGKVTNLKDLKIITKTKLVNEDFNFKTPDNTNVTKS